MPLLVYRPALFENTAENQQFRALCAELKRRVDAQDSRKNGQKSLWIMVGNFNFAEKEFDAFLIKKEGIVLIEFKNFGGKITVTNNEWKGESEGRPFIIKGGSGGKTPFEQARLNRNAFIRNISDSGALSHDRAQKISSLVVFNHKSEIDNKLRYNVQTWLNLTDNTDFFGAIESIVDKDIHLSPVDMRRIADRIVLDDDYIVEEFSDIPFLEDIWNDPDELQAFSDASEGIVAFSDEPDPFDADQKGELDLNPEQNPDLVEIPAPEPPGTEEQTVVVEPVPVAIPNDDIPLYVSNYLAQIQNAAMPNIEYCVYDCTKSAPAVGFDISDRYLIKVAVEPNKENEKSLKNFIRRKVYLGPDCLYWTYGESIPTIRHHIVEETPSVESGLVFRNSSTILAPWLDSFIFDKLGASYDPRYNRFAYNDDLTEDEAKIYLGTYFPRSYAENFLIFENMLMHPGFRTMLSAKQNLSILSIGAGTGGDVIGLLTAIDKFLPAQIDVTIVSLDANQHSLNLQNEVVDRYKSLVGRKITMKQYCERIGGKKDLQDFAHNNIPDESIDFILFAKMGCEIHGKRLFAPDNVYDVFLSCFAQKLTETGVILLLDVTTSIDGSEFMPVILNRGVNNFTRAHPQYSSLLPKSCSVYERKCPSPCFIQQEFRVSHCKKSQDLSKICYRIVARTKFSETLIDRRERRFIITPSKAFAAPNEAVCRYSQTLSDDCDAFNLN